MDGEQQYPSHESRIFCKAGTTALHGEGRRHLRSQTGRQVSSGAAARPIVARLVTEDEERRQMALAARIMDKDRDVLRELAKR
jgi:hypothetical protein